MPLQESDLCHEQHPSERPPGMVYEPPITKYCDDNHLTPRERLELFVPVCRRRATAYALQAGAQVEVPRDGRAYLFISVTQGKSSVLNGDAGKPAPFQRLTTG
jgi:hypothetical protein